VLTTIVATIIVLGILIFIHELGHFLLAKKLGVGVLTFSLGFGPKLIGKKIGETEYKICAIPFGGYVKPIGEDPGEKVNEADRSRSLSAQPIWKRALIIGAGSFFNLFLAVVLFAVVNLFAGIPSKPVIPPKIGEVSADFPAEQAGLKKGDLILEINGKQISRWEELHEIISHSQGKELSLKIDRQGEILEIKVIPKLVVDKTIFGEEVQLFRIGITHPPVTVERQKAGPIKALGYGFVQTWQTITIMVVGIVKLIQGVIPADQIGSPIMIAKMAGEQARRGILELILFTALISINLGILNLLPIPILDGGHLLFLGLEAVLRRPISVKKMEIVQKIGLILLILLMLFAIRNDLVRYFFPEGFGF
jgi:regulator of sigma E protease